MKPWMILPFMSMYVVFLSGKISPDSGQKSVYRILYYRDAFICRRH